ncbi:MAG: efflux RND transporter periplasmic adaptor subunit [Magnetococcales bacterium]|nr:efflux RND transporter periplasmic adaptor subunit [Magnetococcales bacterium]
MMRLGLSLLWMVMCLLLRVQPGLAHGGEDHGAAGAGMGEMLSAGLGSAATGDRFEVVLTDGEEGFSRLYLADIGSGAPVAGAEITVEAAGTPPWTGKGEATRAAGVYRLAWTHRGGDPLDLTLTVEAAGVTDLLLLQLAGTAPASATPSVAANGRKSSATGVALPKASQFLLDLRTVPAASREVAETVRLVGRVIPDPATHARIHPPFPSRVGYDPDFPPPWSGQRVKRGQTLAVLDPILSATEKAGQRLALFKGERPEGAVGRELILAPIDGRLTDVHIVPGEVVTEGTVLAEIIDPARMWVEAVLHDISLADRISGGTASSRQLPGQRFPLRLVGVSPKIAAENQGLHLQFAVKSTDGQLKAGMPVDVYAETGMFPFGTAIPRGAVLEQGGIPLVWVKTAPERFEGRPVRPGRRGMEWVEILEGLQPGDKVVVQGHNQLHAVR